MEKSDIRIFSLEEFLPFIPKYETDAISEKIDAQIKKDFEDDDVDRKVNFSETKVIDRIKRYQKIVKETKEKYNFTCQICGSCQMCGQRFLMDNGGYYCEAHHLTPLSEDGSQDEENIIILCANHHRMFHYAREQINIGNLIDGKRIITINQQVYEIPFT